MPEFTYRHHFGTPANVRVTDWSTGKPIDVEPVEVRDGVATYAVRMMPLGERDDG
jgi:hypothetical protein